MVEQSRGDDQAPELWIAPRLRGGDRGRGDKRSFGKPIFQFIALRPPFQRDRRLSGGLTQCRPKLRFLFI
jgi:hypothetical protein